MSSAKRQTACPCGGVPLAASFQQCCGRYIDGGQIPESAERLMRSRYTAYFLGKGDYIQATWHASTRPPSLQLDPPNTPHGVRWLGLQIHEHRLTDTVHAEVRFTARYREGGKAHRMNELSRFVQERGQWFYIDGDVSDT